MYNITKNGFLKTLLIICLFLLSEGSRNTKVQDKLLDKIATLKDGDTIALKDYTSFTWDTLYAFNCSVDESEIQALLHHEIETPNLFCNRIYFLNKAKLDWIEYIEVDLENSSSEEIWFGCKGMPLDYYVVSVKGANFKIKKPTIDDPRNLLILIDGIKKDSVK